MDFLPPTAASLVFARETYTPYSLLETVECPNCRLDKALYVCYRSDDRKGFALHLQLMCSKCDAEIGDTYSSPTLETSTKPSPFMINDTFVLFFYHRVRAHCSESVLWYSRNTSHATEDFPEEREEDQSEGNRGHQRSAAIVRDMHFGLNPDFPADQPVPIAVSFDGTWQKRGHTSMYGVVAAEP